MVVTATPSILSGMLIVFIYLFDIPVIVPVALLNLNNSEVLLLLFLTFWFVLYLVSFFTPSFALGGVFLFFAVNALSAMGLTKLGMATEVKALQAENNNHHPAKNIPKNLYNILGLARFLTGGVTA